MSFSDEFILNSQEVTSPSGSASARSQNLCPQIKQALSRPSTTTTSSLSQGGSTCRNRLQHAAHRVKERADPLLSWPRPTHFPLIVHLGEESGSGFSTAPLQAEENAIRSPFQALSSRLNDPRLLSLFSHIFPPDVGYALANAAHQLALVSGKAHC